MTDVFDSRPTLAWLRDYARAIRVSPEGLAGAVFARVSAATPPSVVVSVTPDDMPLSLNLDVAMVGPTGSGKGKSISHSRHILPAPVCSPLMEVKPKTGESIPAKYVRREQVTDMDGKPVKGEYRDKVVTDRLLAVVPEIVSLRAAMQRQGSVILPVLLEGFSNEPLGDDTKGAEYRIKLPPYAYRLSSSVGTQPYNSDILFDEKDTGLAGRFLYMRTDDPDAPDTRPEKPSDPFPFQLDMIPEGNSFTQIEALIEAGARENLPDNGSKGYPLTVMHCPPEAIGYVDDMQKKGARGQLDPLDAHRVEIVAKLAAILRLMERRTPTDPLDITPDDWRLALEFMDMSDHTRTECFNLSRRSQVQAAADAVGVKLEARDIAEANRLETVKRRVLKILDETDPGREGMKGYEIRKKCGKYQKTCYEAVELLFDSGLIDRLGKDMGKTSGNLWALPADTKI